MNIQGRFKDLVKRTIEIRGKTIPILAILVFLSIPTLAVTVNMFAQTETEVGVEKALDITDGFNYSDGTVYGGESVTVSADVDNRADAEIGSLEVFTVESVDGDVNESVIQKIKYDEGNTSEVATFNDSLSVVNGSTVWDRPMTFNSLGNWNKNYTVFFEDNVGNITVDMSLRFEAI